MFRRIYALSLLIFTCALLGPSLLMAEGREALGRSPVLAYWVTFGSDPSHDFSLWGHAGIAIGTAGHLTFYDFGTFSKSDVARVFLSGNLNFEWHAYPLMAYIAAVKRMSHRSIEIDQLTLSPQQVFALQALLEDKLIENSGKEIYSYYSQNCLTAPRDLLASAVGPAFKNQFSQRSPVSLRDMAIASFPGKLGFKILLSALNGATIDGQTTRWNSAFTPTAFKKMLLGKAPYAQHSISPPTAITTRSRIVFQRSIYREQSISQIKAEDNVRASLWGICIGLIMLLIGIKAPGRQMLCNIWGGLASLVGIALLALQLSILLPGEIHTFQGAAQNGLTALFFPGTLIWIKTQHGRLPLKWTGVLLGGQIVVSAIFCTLWGQDTELTMSFLSPILLVLLLFSSLEGERKKV